MRSVVRASVANFSFACVHAILQIPLLEHEFLCLLELSLGTDQRLLTHHQCLTQLLTTPWTYASLGKCALRALLPRSICCFGSLFNHATVHSDCFVSLSIVIVLTSSSSCNSICMCRCLSAASCVSFTSIALSTSSFLTARSRLFSLSVDCQKAAFPECPAFIHIGAPSQ